MNKNKNNNDNNDNNDINDINLPLLLLTVPQAAAICQVSTDRVYQWSYDPDFPVIVEAHQLRIHARKFDDWLAARAELGRGQSPQESHS